MKWLKKTTHRGTTYYGYYRIPGVGYQISPCIKITNIYSFENNQWMAIRTAMKHSSNHIYVSGEDDIVFYETEEEMITDLPRLKQHYYKKTSDVEEVLQEVIK